MAIESMEEVLEELNACEREAMSTVERTLVDCGRFIALSAIREEEYRMEMKEREG